MIQYTYIYKWTSTQSSLYGNDDFDNDDRRIEYNIPKSIQSDSLCIDDDVDNNVEIMMRIEITINLLHRTEKSSDVIQVYTGIVVGLLSSSTVLRSKAVDK